MSEHLNCLLLPLKEHKLLLPNVLVAEIMPFSQLFTTASNRPWILGRLGWHGASLPALCYEVLNQQNAPVPNPYAHFAVLHALNKHPQLPNYGVLIQAPPQALRLAASELEPLEESAKGQYDAHFVRLENGQHAIVPNLDAIENVLLSAL